MMISLQCPSCKLQRQFQSWWNLFFGEDYATYKEEKVQSQMADAAVELSRVCRETAELERQMEEVWKTIPPETLVKARQVEQKLLHLRERRQILVRLDPPNHQTT